MSAKDKLFVDSCEFFREIVTDAFEQRKVTTFPHAQHYLVNLLQHYISSSNLFTETDNGQLKQETLAEMLWKANSSDSPARSELLKRLGDTSLYVSGFFGDSLSKKVVDIDYYAEMGGIAYSSLAGTVREDVLRKVYEEYSHRFLEFVEVLTYISQRVLIQTDENLLRLYDRYLQTGSKLAKELLLEKGIIPSGDKKSYRQ